MEGFLQILFVMGLTAVGFYSLGFLHGKEDGIAKCSKEFDEAFADRSMFLKNQAD